jgi:uncharacterized protein
VRITVRDFTVVGELVASLSDEDLVTVAGPWWALRPDSPVYRDARLAAARDAMVRAREYADAFGGGIAGHRHIRSLTGSLPTGLSGSPALLRHAAPSVPSARSLIPFSIPDSI